MTRTKKYHPPQSYIALVIIAALQFAPFTSSISYADEIADTPIETVEVVEAPPQEIPQNPQASAPTVELVSPLDTTQEGVSSSEDLLIEATTTNANSTSVVPTLLITATTISDTILTEGSSTLPIVDFSLKDDSTASSSEEISTSPDFDELPIGTTTISTGISIATANVLNLINTTSINSEGTIILENILGGGTGDIDLRPSSSTSTCTLLACNGVDSVTAKISSEAVVDNTISLIATSGSNEITTSDVAVIRTGEAYVDST